MESFSPIDLTSTVEVNNFSTSENMRTGKNWWVWLIIIFVIAGILIFVFSIPSKRDKVIGSDSKKKV